MSHDFEGQSKARNMHGRRLALGRALTSEKYANKLLR